MSRIERFIVGCVVVAILAALCAIGCICFGLSEGGYAL